MSSTTTTLVKWNKLPTDSQTPNSSIPVHATIDDLLRSYAAELVDTPLVAYPVKGVSDFEEYTAEDLDKFADAAAARYMSVGINPAVSTRAMLHFLYYGV
jgi:hypothetical protein